MQRRQNDGERDWLPVIRPSGTAALTRDDIFNKAIFIVKQMQVRAKERGVTLPDSPPMGGHDMGPDDGGMIGPGGGRGR